MTMATTTAKPNIQIDDLVRPMNTEEHTAYKAQQAEAAKAQAAAEAKIAARESALAKLAALGLTEQEIAAL
jgi:DNA-binding NarL/FixJ family response regulator